MSRYITLNIDQSRVLDLIASASVQRPISQSAVTAALYQSMPQEIVFDALEALADARLISHMRHTVNGVSQDVYWPTGLRQITAPTIEEIRMSAKPNISKSSRIARFIMIYGPIKSGDLGAMAREEGIDLPTKNLHGLMASHLKRGEIIVKRHNGGMWYMTAAQAEAWEENKTAENEAAYTAMAEENDRLRVDVEKWRGLADANAVLTKVRQQRVDREERLGLVPNVQGKGPAR